MAEPRCPHSAPSGEGDPIQCDLKPAHASSTHIANVRGHIAAWSSVGEWVISPPEQQDAKILPFRPRSLRGA